jgi:hypothetical protein
VQPELYASLRPQTYDAGMGKDRDALADGQLGNRDEQRKAAAERSRNAPAATPPPSPAGGMGGGGFGGYAGAKAEEAEYKRADNFTASVSSIASAAKVGELFQYTVGNVSLPRQRSAMIPIVTDDVEIERLSIYNPAVLAKNPLYGARVKNTTGKHLLQGPITVIEGASYAGDARVDNVPPGQERLISYGIDLQVLVDGTKNQQTDAIQTGKIVKGVLHISRKIVHTHNYAAESKADKDKTLVVEHAIRHGWKLVEPDKYSEKTDSLYRFKAPLPAGKSTALKVVEELVTGEQISILASDVGALDFYSKTDRIPKPVRDVITSAIGRKHAMTDTQRQIQQRQQEIATISNEQTRIRENIKTVDRNSDYAGRLLKKLNDQETKIEQLQSEIAELTEKFNKQRKDLEDYLQNMNVDEK